MKVGGAVAVLGIGMVASQIGTPHLLTTYECDTNGRKCIRYTQCFYIGMQGWRKFYPGVAPAGDCPGVKFFALDWPPFAIYEGGTNAAIFDPDEREVFVAGGIVNTRKIAYLPR